MRITFDAVTKQAADADTGMVVEFGGFGPEPREREVFFILRWKSKSATLKAGYDSDEKRIMSENKDLDASQLFNEIVAARTRNIYVFNSTEFQHAFGACTNDQGQALVCLIQRISRETMTDKTRFNVYFLAHPSFSLVPVWSIVE